MRCAVHITIPKPSDSDWTVTGCYDSTLLSDKLLPIKRCSSQISHALQLMKVYGEDSHSRSVWVSPSATARDVCHMLVQTAHCSDQENWALLEVHPTLGLGKNPRQSLWTRLKWLCLCCFFLSRSGGSLKTLTDAAVFRAVSRGPRGGAGGSGNLVPQRRHQVRFLQKLRQVRVLQETHGTLPAACCSSRSVQIGVNREQLVLALQTVTA